MRGARDPSTVDSGPFPTFRLLGQEGTPVSWSLMDQTGKLWVAGSGAEYRVQSLVSYVPLAHFQALGLEGASHIMQSLSRTLQNVPMLCDRKQWYCVPL